MARRKTVRVAIIGAGMGGLSAAIAIARAGAEVTVLEQASELGEIGAGIHAFPNVSRFLVRWGVDEIIGDNLVAHEECNTWGAGRTSKLITRTDVKQVVKQAGFPWWVVRRDHLHAGLTESARRHGATFIIGTRVTGLEEANDLVKVTTANGGEHFFDLVIGADGIKSFVRSVLFPSIQPFASSKVAAYRGVVSYADVFAAIPEARAVLRNTLDFWNGPNGYIITYPITGGRELNVVGCWVHDTYITQMEPVDMNEFRSLYKDYSPIVQKILELVSYTQRWPLLQMPRMSTWSNPAHNIVLLGDSAHAKENHIGQGAATAMEDGAFLGGVLGEVVRGVLNVPEAINLYEQRRIPKAWIRQQAARVSGDVNMTNDPERIAQRDRASAPDVAAYRRNPVRPEALPPSYRCWQFFANPSSIPGIMYYDAEADADNAVCEYLQSKGEVNQTNMLSRGLEDKWWGFVDDNGIQDTGEVAATDQPSSGLVQADFEKYGYGKHGLEKEVGDSS